MSSYHMHPLPSKNLLYCPFLKTPRQVPSHVTLVPGVSLRQAERRLTDAQEMLRPPDA